MTYLVKDNIGRERARAATVIEAGRIAFNLDARDDKRYYVEDDFDGSMVGETRIKSEDQ